MRAASDLHLAPHTAVWVFQALADLREHARDVGGPTVIAGDVFDQSKSVDIPLYNRLRDVLRSFPGKVVIVPGNHDQYDGWRNACEGLHGDNVHVVSEPALLPDVGLCIPYMDPSKWAAIVAEHRPRLGKEAPPIVFAHQGFKGSYLNNMVRDREGLPVTGLDGLVVVSGHYHLPQNVAQVIYCGSPYQGSHAETGQRKGFLAWPRVAATRAQVNATWTDWLPERRDYPSVTAPRYWTVDWDGQGKPTPPPGYREGDIVRVRTVLTRDQLDAPQVGKALKAAGLAGASVLAAPAAASSRVDLRSVRPVDALAEYIETAGKADPEELRSFMEEVGAWPAA